MVKTAPGIVLDGSGVWGQQWDLGTGVVPGVTGLERGPWASLVTAVNPSYSQHTRYIHHRKKVDGEGRGQGPRVGPAVGGGGGGLESLDANSEYTQELTELSLGSWERAMESAGTSSLDGHSHHWRTETDH